MKKVCLLAVLFAIGVCGTVRAEEKFKVRTLAYGDMNLAIVKVDCSSGTCWLAKGSSWNRIHVPAKLPTSDYDISLTNIGKASWVLTLWNTQTGKTYLYSSGTRKWRPISN